MLMNATKGKLSKGKFYKRKVTEKEKSVFQKIFLKELI